MEMAPGDLRRTSVVHKALASVKYASNDIKRYVSSVALYSRRHCFITRTKYGPGWGQVESSLAFYSDNLSSNPNEAYSFFSKICVWKERKQTKRGRGWRIWKTRAKGLKSWWILKGDFLNPKSNGFWLNHEGIWTRKFRKLLFWKQHLQTPASFCLSSVLVQHFREKKLGFTRIRTWTEKHADHQTSTTTNLLSDEKVCRFVIMI